jgi:hypothetical protein
MEIECYKIAQHALAGDGSTGGEKSRRQSRFPRYAAADKSYNGIIRGGGLLAAPEALAIGQNNYHYSMIYELFAYEGIRPPSK